MTRYHCHTSSQHALLWMIFHNKLKLNVSTVSPLAIPFIATTLHYKPSLTLKRIWHDAPNSCYSYDHEASPQQYYSGLLFRNFIPLMDQYSRSNVSAGDSRRVCPSGLACNGSKLHTCETSQLSAWVSAVALVPLNELYAGATFETKSLRTYMPVATSCEPYCINVCISKSNSNYCVSCTAQSSKAQLKSISKRYKVQVCDDANLSWCSVPSENYNSIAIGDGLEEMYKNDLANCKCSTYSNILLKSAAFISSPSTKCRQKSHNSEKYFICNSTSGYCRY